MALLRIGLVGAGAMGTNHARVIATSPAATLAVVVDPDTERAAALADRYDATSTPDVGAAAGCDAVVVASPTETHVELALGLLAADRPLLVEKPLAPGLDDARRLVAEADRRGVPLMCGFVERFNSAVITALELLDTEPHHIVSIRHSPAAPRITASVVHDLLIHDIDLAVRFAGGQPPAAVKSSTWRPEGAEVAEVADCTINFAGGALATLSASRASQRKLRSCSLATATQLIEIDLLRQDVTVYRHVSQEQIFGAGPSYRAETIIDVPFVRHAGEPLALQFAAFVGRIEGDKEDTGADVLIAHEIAAAVVDPP